MVRIVGCIIFVGFLAWGWMKVEPYFTSKMQIAHDAPVKGLSVAFSDEDLLSRFEKHQVFSRNDWEAGEQRDGTPFYTSDKQHATHYSTWRITKDDVGVMIVTPGNMDDLEFEFALAMTDCHTFAKVMMDGNSDSLLRDVKTVMVDTFEKINYKKMEKDVRRDGIVGGQSFHIFFGKSGGMPLFSCFMNRKQE